MLGVGRDERPRWVRVFLHRGENYGKGTSAFIHMVSSHPDSGKEGRVMNNTFKVGVDHGEGDMTVFACGNCGVAIPMPNCPSCAALRAEKDARIREGR